MTNIVEQHLQTAAVRMGFDLGLFKLLSVTNDSWTVFALSQKTGVDELLMSKPMSLFYNKPHIHMVMLKCVGRYMRYLGGIRAVEEIGQDEYIANHTTRNLSQKVAESGISHW